MFVIQFLTWLKDIDIFFFVRRMQQRAKNVDMESKILYGGDMSFFSTQQIKEQINQRSCLLSVPWYYALMINSKNKLGLSWAKLSSSWELTSLQLICIE